MIGFFEFKDSLHNLFKTHNAIGEKSIEELKSSNIASDIKSIFPNCKYLLALKYTFGATDNKLLRNGKHFDNIIYFEEKDEDGKTASGDSKHWHVFSVIAEKLI